MVYLIKSWAYTNLDINLLLNYIRTKRIIANPNSGFIKQLEEYYIFEKSILKK